MFDVTPYDPWDGLAMFESHDFLKDTFNARHQRDLKPAKAQEISAHLRQARHLFDQGRQSSTTVAPLLLYYGVLALSRSLILFLEPSMREAALSQAHGLQAVRWRQSLGTDLSGLEGLKVSSQSGTLSELLRATEGREWGSASTSITGRGTPIVLHCSDSLPDGFSVTFGDLIARMPIIASEYETVFDRFPHAFGCHVTLLQTSGYSDFEVMQTRLGLPDLASVRTVMNVSQEIELLPRSASPYPALCFRIHHLDPLQPELPQIAVGEYGIPFIIAPFGGNRISSVGRLFIASYIMGMLVRYFPTTWASLTTGGSGDRLSPVVRLLPQRIAMRFPQLILKEFARETGKRFL